MGLFAFVLYLQLESFYYLCYTNFIYFNKLLRINLTKVVNAQISTYANNSLYFFFFLLSFFFQKSTTLPYASVLTLSVLFLAFLDRVLFKITNVKINNNMVYLVIPTFAIFLFFISFVKSLLVLFFFIELYSVLYYFCFLSSYNFTSQTLLKYKHGILFLLWNNFLTSVFLAFGCFLILKTTGTTSFAELNILGITYQSLFIFLFGLFWKLGLPIFHFLKLEIYKFLLRENVFLFSILTTLINVVILVLCLSQPIFLNTLFMYNWLILVFIFSILLVLVNLNLSNILYFFAFSSVFTLSTVLSVFVL